MRLYLTEKDDDIKFLIAYLNTKQGREVEFIKSDELNIVVDENNFKDDELIKYIFEINNEQCNNKMINEFKSARLNPRTAKEVSSLTVLVLLNYINLVKQMLETASLKNKDYIDQVTSEIKKNKINFKFDPDFYLLEIKSGLIKEIEPVEGMDKIYCEKVISDHEYTICSGLRAYYEKKELLNNKFLFIFNMKKVKFQGLESEGMICCVKEDAKVEVLKVTKDENTRLKLEGYFDIFNNLSYGKIDIKKAKYKLALEEFKIIDNHLTFKGIKILCGGEYVITQASNGPVS